MYVNTYNLLGWMYVNKYITVMNQPEDTQESEHSSTDTNESAIAPVLNHLSHAQTRSNQMILIGAPNWVKKIIHLMHIARITEVRDWSRLTPTRNPDEVISLMQRPRAEE